MHVILICPSHQILMKPQLVHLIKQFCRSLPTTLPLPVATLPSPTSSPYPLTLNIV